ncbi:MAG TPA: serine/threonine-protein kinase, partial [Polyangiales bacterium]
MFAVTHQLTSKRLAVKWLLPKWSREPEAVDRFVREAKIAGRIDHPNVVRIYDVEREAGAFYLVMELLSGEPLAYRLASRGAFSVFEACRLLHGIARGVAAAHAVGVIHRDLKPDNVFLCSSEHADEVPKILDFGVSRMRTLHGEVRGFRTLEGALVGTPYYLAPEQVQSREAHARSDVYALGVILYQLLCDQLPYTSDKLPELLEAIVKGAPVRLRDRAPDVPIELVGVVETAMARDPDRRFASAHAFAQALQPFLESGTTSPPFSPARRTSGATQAGSSRALESTLLTARVVSSRRRISRPLVGLVCLLLLLAGVVRFWSLHAPRVTASAARASPHADRPLHDQQPEAVRSPLNMAATVPSTLPAITAALRPTPAMAPQHSTKTAPSANRAAKPH